MKTIKIVGAVSLTLLMTGCVPHWSKTQCTSIDMKQQGTMDGRAGMASSRFAKYQTDCNRFSINLNRSQYLQGWRIGNRDYCRPNNLYAVGKTGKPYPTVCNAKPAQRNAYGRGRRLYTQIQHVKTQIASIDDQLNKTQRIKNDYNNTLNKIAQDRADIASYRHPKNDFERDQLNQARADLASQKVRARELRTELIASQAVDLATPGKRAALMRERARLENRLITLESRG